MRSAVLASSQSPGNDFVSLTIKGKPSETCPWKAVTVKPVVLKGRSSLQFAYFTAQQCVVKNAEAGTPDAEQRLAELLGGSLPFTAFTLSTQAQVTSVQMTRGGKAIVHRQAAPARAALPCPAPLPPATTPAPSPATHQQQHSGGPEQAGSTGSVGASVGSSGDADQAAPRASGAVSPADLSALPAGLGVLPRRALIQLDPPPSLADAAQLGSSSGATQGRQDPEPSAGVAAPSLGHDRRKRLPIQPDVPHPFLTAIGLQTGDGKLRADMVDKMAQVNQFLQLLTHTGLLPHLAAAAAAEASAPIAAGPAAARTHAEQPAGAAAAGDGGASSSPAGEAGVEGRVRLLDCGCGSSHLTFGTWHYLNNVLGIPAQITGVDSNRSLMERSNRWCRDLGMPAGQAQFVTAPIAGFQPAQPPHVVLALHACDTATDEALALGVRQGAPLLLAVPCCHKHMQRQLSGRTAMVPPFEALMRHGILRQRTVDMLTDSLRAALLRVLGYKTDIVEFISFEHTPRNLLIRAVRHSAPAWRAAAVPGATSAPSDTTLAAWQEYVALKNFWGVTPHLETLLQAELSPLLASSPQHQQPGIERVAV